jgi:hypothetical protein
VWYIHQPEKTYPMDGKSETTCGILVLVQDQDGTATCLPSKHYFQGLQVPRLPSTTGSIVLNQHKWCCIKNLSFHILLVIRFCYHFHNFVCWGCNGITQCLSNCFISYWPTSKNDLKNTFYARYKEMKIWTVRFFLCLYFWGYLERCLQFKIFLNVGWFTTPSKTSLKFAEIQMQAKVID